MTRARKRVNPYKRRPPRQPGAKKTVQVSGYNRKSNYDPRIDVSYVGPPKVKSKPLPKPKAILNPMPEIDNKKLAAEGRIFARFQDSPALQLNRGSVHNDINEIYIRLENEEDEDLLFETYEDSLSLRKNIDAEDLFEKIKKVKTFDEAQELTEKYPINGVCSFRSNGNANPDNYDRWVAGGHKYLIIFEGEEVGSCEDGEVAMPKRVIKVVKTGYD